MSKNFTSLLSGFNLISKKKRSSRPWRHLFLRFYVDLQKKKKSPLYEFCNFSPRFVRHTRARRREPQLSTIFGEKQKRRFLMGEKTPKFPKFQSKNAGKNFALFALFCAYREHWLWLLQKYWKFSFESDCGLEIDLYLSVCNVQWALL